MSALSILAIATGAADDEAAIAVAADLARRHRSIAVVVTFFPMPIAAMTPTFAATAMSGQIWQAMEGNQDDIRAKIDSVVRRQAQRAGLSGRPESGLGLVVAPPRDSGWATLMCELPLADLVIVAQSSVSGEGPWTGPLSEALMEGRAAVYVARDAVSAAGRPAAVAWDGSLEAGRAIRAAAPILKDASEVAILQDPGGLDNGLRAQADPKRVMDYLRGHGVAVDTVINVRGRKIGPSLLRGATDFGAELLVAGAYRHSRLQEAIFGGATQAFLSEAKGPHLLIAH